VSNPKVFEFAKEVGMTPLALMDKIREWQLPVKSHMAELEPELLEQIKVRLRGSGKSADAPKKKAVARKAPAKKVEAKKAEAVAAAPAPTGKSTVVRRKSTPAADEAPAAAPVAAAPEEEAAPEEVTGASAAVKKTVRRKPEDTIAQESPPPMSGQAGTVGHKAAEEVAEIMPPAAVVEAAPAPVVEEKQMESVKTPASTGPVPARKKEVVVGVSGVSSSTTPAAQVGRKNIIGRMDLSRVQNPGGGPGGQRQQGGPGGAGGAARPSTGFGGPTRTGPSRNLRAGFVAASGPDVAPPPIDDTNRKRGVFDKKKRVEVGAVPAPAREKEGEVVQFNAVEFRKREMVFQPKKRKEFLNRQALKTEITKPKASKRVVKIYGTMKLSDLGQEIGVKAGQLTKALVQNGVMATPNTDLDFDTIALIVPEFGWEAQNVQRSAEQLITDLAAPEASSEMIIRPPVVTIMGHVDHGKTSLLDAIRKTDVAAGEAGGITQHIGAYSVKLEDGSLITFLDTPGHEAFTAMRARGANATDVAVIVVAADDGMMPQTAEAVNHAKAAGVPIIVAINKMDKPGANPEKVKQQLTEFELVPEEWGGTTIYVPVSAVKKTGLKELLEQIKLVAEIAELKADPKRPGTGLVIEAKLEKGKGPVATILVKDGSVRVGQHIVAGTSIGKVKSLMNDKGERVQEVGPGMPVEIQGLDEVPQAGDRFDIVKDEGTGQQVVANRRETLRIANTTKKLSLEDIFSKVTKGDVKELAIVLKADVHGSVEAIRGMLEKINTKEVKTRLIHAAVGGVTESDVLLAHTAKGIILGFNVRPDMGAQNKAKQIGVDIRTYTIVYEMMDEIKKAMAGLLTPDVVEKVMGRAEVRNTFTVPKIGMIAGCFVADGKIQRSNMVRLIREGKIVYEGKIASLKRFKDDAKEVQAGFECGIGIESFNDLKVGDAIEAFVKEEVARELTPMDAQT
jgi:translation initiation factor IF-2